MSIVSKPAGIGLAVLGIAALVLSMMLWSTMSNDQNGVGDLGKVKGVIEYTVRDASGAIKERVTINNNTTPVLLNAARDRLGVAVAGLTADNRFDNIQAANADLAGASAAANLSANLDANPNGTNAGAAGADGVYTATQTFTATGASTIEELQLTSGNATSGTSEAAGAFQDVNITLADTDTLTVTWTVTIS